MGFLFCCFDHSILCTVLISHPFWLQFFPPDSLRYRKVKLWLFPVGWHSAEAHITRSKPLRNIMFHRDYHTINFIAFVLLGITLLSYPLHLPKKSRPIPPGLLAQSCLPPIPYTFLKRIGLAPHQDPLDTGFLLVFYYSLHISPKSRPNPLPRPPGHRVSSPTLLSPTHFSVE